MTNFIVEFPPICHDRNWLCVCHCFQAADCFFVMFMLLFFVTRIIMYPYIVWSSLYESPKMWRWQWGEAPHGAAFTHLHIIHAKAQVAHARHTSRMQVLRAMAEERLVMLYSVFGRRWKIIVCDWGDR